MVKKYNDTVSILESALKTGKGLKYRILADTLAALIREGVFAPGEKLPAHRVLAFDLSITPGTVSKAYGELERLGLVTSHVGRGTFVRDSRVVQEASTFQTWSPHSPEIIDMSVNQAIPTEASEYFRDTLQAIDRDDVVLDMLYRYAPDAGHAHHREAGAAWISYNGYDVRPQEIICTNGGQHALFCSLLALVRPGGVVATERFTYPGLISASRVLGIRLIGLDMDEQGLLPDALEAACRQHRIDALYCTPTLQNPTTATMSAERLKAVAEVCRRHNVFIIEDQAHAMLTEERQPPLRHFVPEHTVTVAGLSKAIASGLRAGFVHAPQRLVGRIAGMVRSTCWMATPLPLEFADRWIKAGHARAHLQSQRREIHRRKALVQGLLSGVRYSTHPDSPHFWIEIPEPWRASEVCSHLRRRNCLVAPAEAFAADRACFGQYIRASVSLLDDDEERLLRGFETLAQVLNAPESAVHIT